VGPPANNAYIEWASISLAATSAGSAGLAWAEASESFTGYYPSAPPTYCSPSPGCLEHLENFTVILNANLWEGDFEASVGCDPGAQAYATWSLGASISAAYAVNGTVFFTGSEQSIGSSQFTNVTGDGTSGGYPGNNSVSCGGMTSGTAESVNAQMSGTSDIVLNFNSSVGGWYETGGGSIKITILVQAYVAAGIVVTAPGVDTSIAWAGLTMPVGSSGPTNPDNFIGLEDASFNWFNPGP
jgi:hypothetical protein